MELFLNLPQKVSRYEQRSHAENLPLMMVPGKPIRLLYSNPFGVTVPLGHVL